MYKAYFVLKWKFFLKRAQAHVSKLFTYIYITKET